jgi:Cu2+-exporting ATPase
VSEVVALADLREDEVLAWAIGVETQSEHPIARAVVRAAEERRIEPKSSQAFMGLPGRGAQGVVDGRSVKVVSPGRGASAISSFTWSRLLCDRNDHATIISD